LPTIVVATDAFLSLAREAARDAGIESARLLSLSHPIGGESGERLDVKADQALDALLALLRPD
jgi:hypothetical protein